MYNIVKRLTKNGKTMRFIVRGPDGGVLVLEYREALELIRENSCGNAIVTVDGIIRAKHGSFPEEEIRREIKNRNSKNIMLIEKFATRTSHGVLSKGWYKINGVTCLVKGNSVNDIGAVGYEPYAEVLASRILRALGFNAIEYKLAHKNLFGEISASGIEHVSVCASFISSGEVTQGFLKYVATSIAQEKASHEDCWKWLHKNRDKLDLAHIYKMFACDALLGNTDRHLNNWDIIRSSQGARYAPMFDFGGALLSLESLATVRLLLNSSVCPAILDRARPFADFHAKQIATIAEAKNKCNIKCGFGLSNDEVTEKIQEIFKLSEDIKRGIGDERFKAALKFVLNRTHYLEVLRDV